MSWISTGGNKFGGCYGLITVVIGMLCGFITRPAEADAAIAPQARGCCSVVELRRYIIYPGMREDFISLFEKEFIESQERVGITLVGQFRDLSDPYRFTWVRGFSDMDARKKALTDFYSGPVWLKHRDKANPALYDNDDVLLLRPAAPGSGFLLNPSERPPVSAADPRDGFVVATIYYFADEVTPAFIARFNDQLMPLFERSGARVIARFVSEKRKNTFERLPVRENVNAFVWFASFADRLAYHHYQERLDEDARWRAQLFGELYKSLMRPPEVLMLTPTARSLAH